MNEGSLHSTSWAGRVALAALATAIAFAVGCQTGPPPTPIDRAHTAFDAGDLEAAFALYEEAARTQPQRRAEALHGAARVRTLRRDPERALALYRAVAKADGDYFTAAARGDYAQTLLLAGQMRLEADELAASIDALEALHRIDPDYPGLSKALAQAWTAHGEQLSMHGRRTEAMARFEGAMALRPQAAEAWIGAAEILIATGRKKEALALLSNASRYNPSDGRVRALTVQAMGVY